MVLSRYYDTEVRRCSSSCKQRPTKVWCAENNIERTCIEQNHGRNCSRVNDYWSILMTYGLGRIMRVILHDVLEVAQRHGAVPHVEALWQYSRSNGMTSYCWLCTVIMVTVYALRYDDVNAREITVIIIRNEMPKWDVNTITSCPSESLVIYIIFYYSGQEPWPSLVGFARWCYSR